MDITDKIASWVVSRVSTFLYEKAKKSIAKAPEQNAVDAVLKRLALEGNDLNLVRGALNKFAGSKQLKTLVTECKKAGQELQVAELHQCFVAVTGFTYSVGSQKTSDLIGILWEEIDFQSRKSDPDYRDRLSANIQRQSKREVLEAIAARSYNEEQVEGIKVDIEITTKLDSARDLLNKEQPNAALQILENVVSAIKQPGVKVALHTLWRLHSNLGVAYLKLENYDKANEEFRTAVGIESHRAISWVRCAQACYMLERYDESLSHTRSALNIDPEDKSAFATQLLVLYALNDQESLESTLKQRTWAFSDSRCLLALGQNALDDMRLDEAENLFLRSIEIDNTESQTHFLLGLTLYLQFREVILQDPPLDLDFSPELRALLERACSSCTTAIEILKSQDHDLAMARCLINRAVVRAALGENQGALDDLSVAIFKQPDSQMAVINKSRALIALGREEEAMTCLEKCQATGLNESAKRKILGAIYLNRHEFEKAVTYLEPEYALTNDALHGSITDQLLDCLVQLDRNDRANEIIDDIERNHSEDAEYLYYAGRHKRRELNEVQAIEYLRRAKDLATPNFKVWVRLELARALASHGSFLSACEEYRHVVEHKGGQKHMREFIMALYEGGLLFAAYKRARELRIGQRKAIHDVTEICEFYYLLNRGLNSDALHVVEDLIALAPENSDFVIYKTLLLIGLERNVEAKEFWERSSAVHKFSRDCNVQIELIEQSLYTKPER